MSELGPPRRVDLEAFRAEIEEFQRLRPDLDPVRRFNHQMVEALEAQRSLAGLRVLDVGASYRGYALEQALDFGAVSYVGFSLDIHDQVEVQGPRGVGRLLRMDADRMDFVDQSFDLLLTVSTFEHFQDGARVLREMHRVLRPGGLALLNFEPVWTASYGHHLHHVPDVAGLIPPWAHLLWTPESMRAALTPRWPAGTSMTLEEVVRWVYVGDVINRLPIDALRRQLAEGPLAIEWMVPLADDESGGKRAVADYLARVLPWSAEDLMTRGYSALLAKRR